MVTDLTRLSLSACGCAACRAGAQASFFADTLDSVLGADGTLSMGGVVLVTPSADATSGGDGGAGAGTSGGGFDPIPVDPQPSGSPNDPSWTAGQAATEAALPGFQTPIGTLNLSAPGNSALGSYTFAPNPDAIATLNGLALTPAQGSNFYA